MGTPDWEVRGGHLPGLGANDRALAHGPVPANGDQAAIRIDGDRAFVGIADAKSGWRWPSTP
jgi:hypothetical protein